jgi:sulfur-carrier protein
MNVRVRLFAAARQTAGRDALELELPAGATVGQLRRQLVAQFPALGATAGQMLLAVNRRYAQDAEQIPPDAEIACIPPVSGG